MLRHKYKAAAAILGLSVLISGVPVSAAENAVPIKQVTGKGFYYGVWKLYGCELPEIPYKECPENQKPEQPDASQPEQPVTDKQSQPVTEKPGQGGTDTPKQEKPDTGKPDINQPDTEKTDTNQPDKDQEKTSVQSYAMQVFKLVNQERAKEGLPALEYDATIGNAATVRAKETEVSFSHTRPDGSAFSTALKAQGVSFRGSGENIAWGQRSPEEVMKGWMNSPGHRANIMNKNYTRMGVGCYQNSKGVYYWTQLFVY